MAKTTFKSRVSGAFKSLANANDKIQSLIIEALDYYVANDNPLYLTCLVNYAGEKDEVIKAYVREHANVYWRDASEGVSACFLKKGKGVAEVKAPERTWYAKRVATLSVVVPEVSVDTAVSRIEKSLKHLAKTSPEAELVYDVISAFVHSTRFEMEVAKARAARSPERAISA